jgi:hypothetical protein
MSDCTHAGSLAVAMAIVVGHDALRGGSGRHEPRHGLVGVCRQGWRRHVGGGAVTH